MPGGQSAPLPWRWQKGPAGGPCITLGLCAQSAAQAAQRLQSSGAGEKVGVWAADAALAGQRAVPAAPAQPGILRARGAGAAPSLANSFADFLEGQTGSSRGLEAQPWASEWHSGVSDGIIDLSLHRGRRTLVALRGSDGQVGSHTLQRAAALPSSALTRHHDTSIDPDECHLSFG